MPARKRTTARESSPPNYHQITEALDGLKYRIESVCPNGASTSTVENGPDEASKRPETLRTRTSVGDAGFNSTEDLLPANSNPLV